MPRIIPKVENARQRIVSERRAGSNQAILKVGDRGESFSLYFVILPCYRSEPAVAVGLVVNPARTKSVDAGQNLVN